MTLSGNRIDYVSAPCLPTLRNEPHQFVSRADYDWAA